MTDYRNSDLEKMKPKELQQYATMLLRSEGYTWSGRDKDEKTKEDWEGRDRFDKKVWKGMQCRSRRGD